MDILYTNGKQFTLNGQDYIGYYNVTNSKYYTGQRFIFGVSKILTKIVIQNQFVQKYRKNKTYFYNKVKQYNYVNSNYTIPIQKLAGQIIQRYVVYSVLDSQYYQVQKNMIKKLPSVYYKKIQFNWKINDTILMENIYKYNLQIINQLKKQYKDIDKFLDNVYQYCIYNKTIEQTAPSYQLQENILTKIKNYKYCINNKLQPCPNKQNSQFTLYNKKYSFYDLMNYDSFCIKLSTKFNQMIQIVFNDFSELQVKNYFKSFFNRTLLPYITINNGIVYAYVMASTTMESMQCVINNTKRININGIGSIVPLTIYKACKFNYRTIKYSTSDIIGLCQYVYDNINTNESQITYESYNPYNTLQLGIFGDICVPNNYIMSNTNDFYSLYNVNKVFSKN